MCLEQSTQQKIIQPWHGPWLDGRDAFTAGKSLTENPFNLGTSARGNMILTEDGEEWRAGWLTAMERADPARQAIVADNVAAARKAWKRSGFTRRGRPY